MNGVMLIENLKKKGVELSVCDNRLQVKAPNGILSQEDRGQLRRLKDEVIAALQPVQPSPRQSFCSVGNKKPFKVFNDFPDGRTVIIETEEEWNALVNHFYQLRLMERRQTQQRLKKKT